MQVSFQYLLLTQEKLALAEAKSLEFFPDTIPYSDDETNFQRNWQRLARTSKGYLYVDHYSIKKVSPWRYYVEWFRGKLGFEDHCNKARVELSLLKYSYYGLVKGYSHATTFSESNILTTVIDSNTLASCQQKILDYYRYHQQSLQPSFWARFFSSAFSFLRSPLQKDFIFGDSIASLCMYSRQELPLASSHSLQLILQLQPQSSLFVMRYLDLVINTFSPEVTPQVLQHNSMMGKAVARKYMVLAKEKLNSNTFYQWMTAMGNAVSNLFGAKTQDPWLEWHRLATAAKALDETIEADSLQDFIKYELHQKNYERVYNLILKLHNVNEQITFINSDQNRKYLVPFLKKDTPLARALAEHYISTAKKSYFGKKQLFEEVSRLASADLDPPYFIQQYLDQNKYAEAAELFKQYPTLSLSTEYRNKLAQHFAHEGEVYYKNGKLQAKTAYKREPYYRLSLQAYKQAAGLKATNLCYTQQVNVHRRLLAQTIFKKPAATEEERIIQLEKVINKYEKSYQQQAAAYDSYLVPNYLKALTEKAFIALQHCLDPLSYSDGVSATEEHQELCKDHLSVAIGYLNRALQIMDKNSNVNLWAKLHFMLGDIKRFFGIDGCLLHLKQAAEAVPENPFYRASFLEVSGNTIELDDWELFPEVGLRPNSYFEWKAERWNKDKIFSKKLGDIHSYVAKKDSVLQNLLGR